MEILKLLENNPGFQERARQELEAEVLKKFIGQSKLEEIIDILNQIPSMALASKESPSGYANVQQNYENLKNEVKTLKNELHQSHAERQILENRKRDLLVQVQFYKDKYDTIENIFKVFDKLDDNVKSGLDGIFRDNSRDKFLMSCASLEKLELLWDFIYYTIENVSDNTEAINNLNIILDYFFDLFSYTNPVYERINTENNENFDSKLHIKIGSKKSGPIQEVKLRGIKNKYTQKILKKSVVQL
ncbi:hypothetical protein AN639_01120 [Candidatus Epulonipiscium fishelsonii]|uniref:Uncharacterized protein n=1 Tax=Candidatus Epulonipiscium fishelsonii TaxID=77094 RepID=A0ACC8X7R6_9FIRM|nr:hypothetical protein AN396_12125 [Epulopiscium sp. SCG-B11WGA-EpuloA1]ONI40709.1 hypothetical protein AN639_01120 [Epulopiscium sp. SCG-B05WGA-EpuloA1]